MGLSRAAAGDRVRHDVSDDRADAEHGINLGLGFFVSWQAPRIATPAREARVEELAVGDLVLTLRGEARRIVWIGVGRVLATRGRRNAATPVIVRKGALADNVPHRDLRVTKGHALYIDDVLIPVEFLVNHRSIIWDDQRAGGRTLSHRT